MAKHTSTPQGGEPAPAAAPVASPAPAVVTSGERDEFVTRLIGRHGTVTAALTSLAGEQLRYRRRAQNAEAVAKDLQTKVPAAGSVVLTGDAARIYNELVAKGVTLDKVPALVTEHAEFKTKHTALAREKDLATAAGTKYDLKVLSQLLGDTALEFKAVNVMKEDKSGVEVIQQPYVILGQGAQQTREDLDAWLTREHPAFAEILKFKEGEGQEGTTKSDASMPKTKVATTASTSGTRQKGAATVVDRAMTKFVRPSQLRAGPAKT